MVMLFRDIKFYLLSMVRAAVRSVVRELVEVVVDGPVQVDERPDVDVAEGDEEYEEAAVRIEGRVNAEAHGQDQRDLHALREHKEPAGAKGHPTEIY